VAISWHDGSSITGGQNQPFVYILSAVCLHFNSCYFKNLVNISDTMTSCLQLLNKKHVNNELTKIVNKFCLH
jgi:hypothetical protein